MSHAAAIAVMLGCMACSREAAKAERPPVVRFCGDEYALDAFEVTCHDPNVVGTSALGDLTALSILSLRGTGITELPRLRHVASITMLDLSNTRVKDLSTLEPDGWKRLQVLDLAGTPVTDLGPVAALPALESLDIENTEVADLSPALRNPSVRRINASRTAITHLPPMTDMSSVEDLNVSYTLVADLSAVRGARTLKTLWIDSTFARDLSPLADASALENVTATHTLAPSASAADLRTRRPGLTVVHGEWSGTPEELRARIVGSRRDGSR